MTGFEEDVRRLKKEFDALSHDVYPDDLGGYVGAALDDVDHTPALLCLLSARLDGSEPSVEQAAGIQYVYTGLGVISRVLEDDSAWRDAGLGPAPEDMELLAAETLVSAGTERLLDDYDVVTRVLDDFGRRNAEAIETAGESIGRRAARETTYVAAVELGFDGAPPEFLREFAGYLALDREPESDLPVDEVADGDSVVLDYLREIRMESTRGARAGD
ncbi:MAG: hypothetical protein ACLFMT_05785 [Halobacteriales archaeon]